MRRVLIAIVAGFAALLLASPTAAPAQAADGSADRALPRHVIRNLDAGEIRNTNRFYVKGKAITYKGKRVTLLRCKTKLRNCNKAGSDRTSSTGKFRITFRGKGHYRIVLNKTPRNRKTNIYIGEVY